MKIISTRIDNAARTEHLWDPDLISAIANASGLFSAEHIAGMFLEGFKVATAEHQWHAEACQEGHA